MIAGLTSPAISPPTSTEVVEHPARAGSKVRENQVRENHTARRKTHYSRRTLAAKRKLSAQRKHRRTRMAFESSQPDSIHPDPFTKIHPQ
jgi:hypothetical protein